MKQSRFLAATAGLLLAATAYGQGFAPHTIANSVFNGNIAAATGGATATGSINELFTSTGFDYSLSSVGTLTDPAPYVYTKTGDNTGTIVEPIAGSSNQLTVTLTFTSPNAGTFAAVYGAGSGVTQQGSFALNAIPAEAPLANMSTRFPLAAGGHVISGLVVDGGVKRRILVRAVGPTLAQAGVSNPLADPIMTVFSGQTAVATNDNWDNSASATFAMVGAGALAANSKDAALVLTVNPGIYTVVVRSTDPSASGEVVVETYLID